MSPELLLFIGLLLMSLSESAAGLFLILKAKRTTPQQAAASTNPLLQRPDLLKIIGAFLVMLGLFSLGLSFLIRPA